MANFMLFVLGFLCAAVCRAELLTKTKERKQLKSLEVENKELRAQRDKQVTALENQLIELNDAEPENREAMETIIAYGQRKGWIVGTKP